MKPSPPARPVPFVAPDYLALCAHVAARVAALVRAKPAAVLGLPTGATPRGVYQALARLHREGGLDFSGVTCFNLDEYYPMPPDSPHSYHTFMQENLFGSVPCRRWRVPDGRPRSPAQIAEDCRAYEADIAACGGIDWQLLGIGRTGHIGFNEPGSGRDSRTRRVTLHPATRRDAAAGFGGLDAVPTEAITMGIGTILDAREIVLLASGAGKAAIVRDVWASPPTESLPASWLFTHPRLSVCLDTEANALRKESPRPQ